MKTDSRAVEVKKMVGWIIAILNRALLEKRAMEM
jgi:hypothetical protein